MINVEVGMKRLVRWFIAGLFISILFMNVAPCAEARGNNTKKVGVPWTGARGITIPVSEIMKAERAQTGSLPFMVREMERENEFEREGLKQHPSSPAVSSWPPLSPEKGQNRVSAVTTAQQIGVNFLGAQISETPGWVPPDIMGDVGPTQIMIHVNGRVKVFDKSGSVILTVADTVFWQAVRNGKGVSDPHVRYDPTSGRWFVCMINTPSTGANRIMVAVSSGSTITTTSSFTFFQFQQDAYSPVGLDAGAFADYPTLAVDANAVYIGARMFGASSSGYLGSTAFVIRKSDLLSGTLTVTAFREDVMGTYSPANGMYTPQGGQNDDPAATEGYFVGSDMAYYGIIDIIRISDPGGTPSASSPIQLTVPTTYDPIQQSAKGSSNKLDALDDRFYAVQIKKNKLTGLTSLWTAHNISVNSGGIADGSGDRNGSRWYEITDLATTPTLRQSGTIYSTASSNPIGYWVPSVAMSGQGHMAFGSSYAGAGDYTSIAVTGRWGTDALGTTQSVTKALIGASSYNAQSTAPQRWGDFTQTVVDPGDDMTMWTFQEYCNINNSWALRVIQLLAPPPVTPSDASPSLVNTGVSNVDVTVTGISASGSGFFDPGSGFVKRIAASVNGGGVTVNSVTFTNPTSITMNISVAGGAAGGARTITVTNPDGQTATSATGIFYINAVSCPMITVSPGILPAGAAGSAYDQTLTASGGVGPYSYAVVNGAIPSGMNFSTSGILDGTPVYGGSYPFTVLATDANNCTGSRSYTLTVTGCPLITLSPTSLPDGNVALLYDQTVTSSGGTGPYTYSVTSGAIPTGLALSSSGELSGYPRFTGSYSFTITAVDGNICSGSQSYSMNINSPGGGTIVLSATATAYSQDFNTLASSGTSNNATPAGWGFNETGTGANATYAANTGTSSTGNTYSYGSAGSTDRAFGSLQTSSVVPTIGAAFMNVCGGAITSLSISYTGEMWRLGASPRTIPDSLVFQLSMDATDLSTGAWTEYPSLSFASPILSGSVGALNGNSSANRTAITGTISGLSIPNGSTFVIRWVDVDASGNDDGLAVDDFSITPNADVASHTITATAGTGGVISPIGAVAVTDAASQAFTVTPDPGYHIDSVLVDGFNQPAAVSAGSYTFSLVVLDHTIRAVFKINTYTITATAGSGGLISPSGAVPVDYGQNQKFTFTPNDHYHIDSVLVDGGKQPVADSYTFNSVSNNHVIRVTFILDQNTITASAGANGNISPAGDVKVFYGHDQQFTMLPSFGFLVDSLIVDNALQTAGPGYTFANVINDHTIRVTFYHHTATVYTVVDARWNLMSLPVYTPDSSAATVYNPVSSYSYEPGTGYVSSPMLARGKGYWLRFSSGSTISLNDTPIDELSIPVVQGWNMIGSISDTILASAITADPLSMSTSQFFLYKNGYIKTDTIYPARGYWVKASEAGTLTLVRAGLQVPAKTIHIVPLGELPPAPPDGVTVEIPREFALEQNYPNPFNPVTVIRFALPKEAHVLLTVFNVLGQRVSVLADADMQAGYHEIRWDASSIPSGMYFYRMQTLEYSAIRKLILAR